MRGAWQKNTAEERAHWEKKLVIETLFMLFSFTLRCWAKHEVIIAFKCAKLSWKTDVRRIPLIMEFQDYSKSCLIPRWISEMCQNLAWLATFIQTDGNTSAKTLSSTNNNLLPAAILVFRIQMIIASYVRCVSKNHPFPSQSRTDKEQKRGRSYPKLVHQPIKVNISWGPLKLTYGIREKLATNKIIYSESVILSISSRNV